MADNLVLGIYWGREGFGAALSRSGIPAQALYASYSSFEQDPGQMRTVADEMKQVSVLQKMFRDHDVTTTHACLTIPSSDVIIRTFIIPSVKPAELDGVISFEAKKYVPFSLNELKYTYDAFPMMEEGVKKMRILFVGVRKDIYENYTNVLVQAGLTLLGVEPASVSLIRALNSKSLISMDKCIAAVQVTEEEGKITIINEGVPIFVRDFGLSAQSPVPGEAVDPEMIKARFFNEVKMSLDFFSRQYEGRSVDEILVIAHPDRRHAWEGVEKDFGVEFRSYDPTSIIDVSASPDMGILSGYGVTLLGQDESLDAFSLSEDVSDRRVSRRKREVDENPIDPKKLIKAGVFAVLLLCSTFFGTNTIKEKKEAALDEIKVELAQFADMDMSVIEKETKKKRKIIKAYKTVPLKSKALYFLAAIPKKLPEGVWLTNLKYAAEVGDVKKKGRSKRGSSGKDKISYVKQEQKFSLTLQGNVYHENSNKQIQIANKLLATLRQDETFSSHFESIQLQNMQGSELNSVRVLNFDIVCE